MNIQATSNVNPQSVSIFNALGQLVIVANGAEQTKMIDVSALQAGNYYVSFLTDDGLTNRQFLKN